MAGNYPDAPSWRMAHDRDGTQWFDISGSGVVTVKPHSEVVKMNDEDPFSGDSVGYRNTATIGCIFPELRDLDGYFINSQGGAAVTSVEVSTDTTNLIDGTWTAIPVGYYGGSSKQGYREEITSSTALAIRGMKFVLDGESFDSYSIHLYGEPAPGENLDRLEMWHPTLDEKLSPAYFDWGDVPQSSSADRDFRVKNLSEALTAKQTRVAFEVLTDASPSVPGQHMLSYGGGSFLAQVNIGDLAAGAISGPVTLRRVTPSDAALSLWTFRVFAESTDWA